MKSTNLQSGQSYVGVIFDYEFKTPSRLCPERFESQNKAFLSQVDEMYFKLGNQILVSKEFPNDLIGTGVQFKSLIKRFPMFAPEAGVIKIKSAPLVSFKIEADMTRIINDNLL